MAIFVQGSDVSSSWVEAMEKLLAAGGQAVNLTVQITDPMTEVTGVRHLLDGFIGDRRAKNRKIQRISTVANTIFPEALYKPQLGANAEAHLYELEERTRSLSRRHKSNRRGTYFERLVAAPTPRGTTFNQLDHAIKRLRGARAQGHQRANNADAGLAIAGDEIAAPVHVVGRDKQLYGFPCLSHLSFSLQAGVLHMTALYRSHDFITRGYGNYVGIGRVLHFVATQSGWPLGEVACISSSATAEIGKTAGFGRGAIEQLVADCRQALGQRV